MKHQLPSLVRNALFACLAPAAALVGCAMNFDAESTGESSQGVRGWHASPIPDDAAAAHDSYAPPANIVRISVPGDPNVRTGILIAPDLVLTSSRWLTPTTDASRIQISIGTLGADTRVGWAVTINPNTPVAIIQTTIPFSNVRDVVIDGRSAQTLVATSANMTCLAYASGSELQMVPQHAVRIDGGNELIVQAWPGQSLWLDDRDAGAPCFDNVGGTWIGFALSSTVTHDTRVFAASGIAFFVNGMRRVALARRSSVEGALMLQTTAPNGTKMCLDVPWANPYAGVALNQFPCNGALNQRWFIDRVGTNRAVFVNAITGTCIDVPGSSTMAGTALQTYTCNGGVNQTWENNGGNHLSPLSAPLRLGGSHPLLPPPRRNLCMSVRGGASNASQPIEQATCVTGAAWQDWISSNVP